MACRTSKPHSFRDKAAALGFRILNATTRSWAAFWWTIAIWVAYQLYNTIEAAHGAFDPYPFTFLVLLITEASYLQNVVLMTDQRLAGEALQQVQDHMVDLLEVSAATGEATLEHVKLAFERDQKVLAALDRLEQKVDKLHEQRLP